MGKNISEAWFLATHGTKNSNQFAALSAEDSMTKVTMVLYHPRIPAGPEAARMLPPCERSRMAIAMVRMTLIAVESEK